MTQVILSDPVNEHKCPNRRMRWECFSAIATIIYISYMPLTIHVSHMLSEMYLKMTVDVYHNRVHHIYLFAKEH